MLRDQGAPHRDRHFVGVLAVPGDLPDPQKPRWPASKIVPLNRNCSGIVPSRRAWKYLVAVTSKS